MHYQENSIETQYTSLSVNSFCDPENPHGQFQKLKGRGAEAKDLLPAAYSALLKHGGSHESFDDMQNALVRLLDIRNCLHVNKHLPILPLAAAKLFKKRTVEFLKIYQHLASTAESKGLLMWNMPTKFHWMWHMGDRALYLNPRKGATWIDEHFVNKMKILVHSCGAGSTQSQAMVKTAMKYQWLLHFLMIDVCGE